MITVFWTCYEENWLMAEDPIPVWKEWVAAKTAGDNLEMCPAVKDYMKNVYGLKSMFDVNIEINGINNYNSNLDIDFFNSKFQYRNPKDNLMSFMQNYAFFTPEKSLVMEAQLTPLFHQTENSIYRTPVPGQFDIGKWFRPIEYSFYLEGKNIDIRRGDVLQYVRFVTDKKIRFIKFAPTEKIRFYTNSCTDAAKKPWAKQLPFFYKRFEGAKSNLLKAIEESVVS